ncbi:tripartite tricarboxylate transporter TctB family protein [Pelagibius litoralis]|uniref:Tripartite tricarboxylate transporter TctB family protein n=1 Tax=Pelagibius litoralis TaxID=374515 RepID=A0A967KG38_9PROT|nr:tripartite tricarboxylate transporter TctB family protein [Pelagibius litoralis]NIA70036.1 tripartite tricarboxylate transporter TctB family protein [Pelagibius litoralis]
MLTRDRIGALLMLAFSIFYWLQISDIKLLAFQADAAFTGRTIPEILAVMGVVLSVALLLRPGSDAKLEVTGFHWRRAALLCVLMIAYGLTVRPAGFLLSTSLFLICSILVLGERRVWVILVASIPLVVLFWALMTQVLGVYIAALPEFMDLSR